jgi:hypothetical protein
MPRRAGPPMPRPAAPPAHPPLTPTPPCAPQGARSAFAGRQISSRAVQGSKSAGRFVVRAEGNQLAKVRRRPRAARGLRSPAPPASAARAPAARPPPPRCRGAARAHPRAPSRTRPQVERVQKAGGLYLNFASDQSVGYLNGTLPGGAPPAARCTHRPPRPAPPRAPP